MAFLKEKGVICYKSEVETGTGKTGTPWSNMTIVVKCDGRNENFDKVAFRVGGNRCIDADKLSIGQRVEVEYSINAFQYTDKNGKLQWGNNVSAFSIKAEGQPMAIVIPTPVKEEEKPVVEDFPF